MAIHRVNLEVETNVAHDSSEMVQGTTPFVFPKWTNNVPLILVIVLHVGAIAAIWGVWYWFSPKFTDVGYQPRQPVPYSHKLHVGELGMDCRYCHVAVDKGPHASVPPTQVCMNCHSMVATDKPSLEPVRDSWESGLSVPWVKIHKIPDYAFFDHSRHVSRNVGCESCHGRIDQMVVVGQEHPLSMGWCLECHRNPEEHLRPLEEITTMGYEPPGGDQVSAGLAIKEANNINPPQDCSGCHR